MSVIFMAAAHWTSFLSAILCHSLSHRCTQISLFVLPQNETHPGVTNNNTEAPLILFKSSVELHEWVSASWMKILSHWFGERGRRASGVNKAGDKMKIIVWPTFISPHIHFMRKRNHVCPVHVDTCGALCFTSGCRCLFTADRTGPPSLLLFTSADGGPNSPPGSSHCAVVL